MTLESKNIQDLKFNIWIVWDNDITKGELYLRAITTTLELAEKYKKIIEKHHREFQNHKYFVNIEARDANHLYGELALEKIKELRF